MRTLNLLLIGIMIWPCFCHAEVGLRVGVHYEPPFVLKDQNGQFSGLSIDLWHKIAQEQGISYEFVEYSDDLGLIRALDFKEIDISINPIHVNEVRLRMLEATQPFYVSSIGVATTQVERSQLRLFLNNFFSLDFLRMILLLLLVIFVFGTILWLAERKHNPRQFRSGVIGLFDGLWWSAVTMTTVGYGDKAPKSKLGRIIAMVWMFSALVIITGFTATVASALTLKSLTSEIQKVQDLQAVERIGTVLGSSSDFFLKNQNVQASQLYESPVYALKGLANKEIEVLLYDKAVLEYLLVDLQLSHRVTCLPVNFNKQYRSFLLPKNSPAISWVNPLLVKHINMPDWQEVLKKYNLQDE